MPNQVQIEHLTFDVNSSFYNHVLSDFSSKSAIYYYIHDTGGYINTDSRGFEYASYHTWQEEKFIENVFESIDPLISLDFTRTYIESQGDINIYCLGDYYYGYAGLTYSTNDSDIEIFWENQNGYSYVRNYGDLMDLDAFTLIHEIGHALGLSHPNNDPEGSWHTSNDTVMSYNFIYNEYSYYANAPVWSTIDKLALDSIWSGENQGVNEVIPSIDSLTGLTIGNTYKLEEIKDYDGNLHGYLGNAPSDVITGYKFQGYAYSGNSSNMEAIFTNKYSGRWVTVDHFDDDKIDFSYHGQGGATRIVGIYEDPLVKAGIVQKDSVFDGSRTFINDLKLDNLILKASGDFDGDGFQEIYFSKVDNTAYLRAVMHADSNIQYANYQNLEQMTNFLTIHGHADSIALIA